MIKIAEFPTRFQADPVFGGTFNPLSHGESVKQERKIYPRPDRQIQGTPKTAVDLDQLGSILLGVPFELDHRDPVPLVERYQSGGGVQCLDGWANAFAKNAHPS